MRTCILLLLLIPAVLFSQQKVEPWQEGAVIFKDVENFWTIFDREYPQIKASTLKKNYINQASPALQEGYMSFIVGKSGKKLAKKVNENLAYYKSLQALPFQGESIETKIREGYKKLATLYPKATFTDLYFAVGRFTSAGAAINGRLIMSIEMFPKTSQKIDGTQTADFASLPKIVMHEVIHYQQKYSDDNSLLAKSITEGCADFVTELVLGSHPNQYIHDVANPKEETLWQEFKTDMDKQNFHNWLYTQEAGRTKDLGYWMGYKIVESYYKKHVDDPQVLVDILHIQDFPRFLKDSGYEQKIKGND